MIVSKKYKTIGILVWLAVNQVAHAQSSTISPGLRQTQMSSVERKNNVKVSLSDNATPNLLDAKASNLFSETQASLSDLQANSGFNTDANSLRLGVFRTKELSNGYVAPPGVADFAAYFRAANQSKGAEQKQNTSATSPGMLGSISNEELKNQEQAEELRAQTSDSIKQILLTSPPLDQKIDLIMRYSELQIERHSYAMELEIKKFNTGHDLWKKTRTGVEPIFKPDNTYRYLQEATSALRSIVTQYPNHARTPEALFVIGFLLTQIQSESSVLYFERLVKTYPQSEYVPHGYLAMGEYYFAKNNFTKAKENYVKVLDFKEPRTYNYAVYKLGWTHFNLRGKDAQELKINQDKSIKSFKLIAMLADKEPNDSILRGLKQDALRDMVLVYAEQGDIQAAQKYFLGLNEMELYLTMLERMAWLNTDAGKYEEAEVIYQKLLQESILNAKLPQYYSKLPSVLDKQRKRSELIKSLQEMSQTFASDGAWVQKFSNQPEIIAKKDVIVAKELKYWAELFHVEAQKSKRVKSYDDALTVYNIYLERYGTLPASYSAHFFKGEILLEKKRYHEASIAYLNAVNLDEKNNLKGKYTKNALFNAISSLELTLDNIPPPALPEAGKVKEKIPLTATHSELISAIDLFAKIYPKDKENLEFQNRAARILYAFGFYPEANIRWTTLAKQYPKSPEISDGFRYMLKVFLERRDWQTAVNECRKYLGINGIKQEKIGKDIVIVLKSALFSIGMQQESKKQFAEAAATFLDYQKEFPDDPDSSKALFNAANNKFKQGKIDDAINILKIILVQYPKSNLIINAHYLIASSYDAIGLFAESAASYERLAYDTPENTYTTDALFRASEERYAIGDYEKAIQNCNYILQTFPNYSYNAEVYLLLGKAFTKINNQFLAANSYASGANKLAGKKATSAVYLYGLAAEAYQKGGDNKASNKMYNAGIHLYNTLGQPKDSYTNLGLALLSTTEFNRVEPYLPQIYKMSITDGLQVTSQFNDIKEEAQNITQKYIAIAKLGNAEIGVACLYRVAELQEFLANTLLTAPPPRGAKAADIEKFKSTLETYGIPQQEEAINLYLTAWNKANETEAMTSWTKKIYEKLVLLRPAEFKKIIEDLTAPSYFSSNIIFHPETKKLLKN